MSGLTSSRTSSKTQKQFQDSRSECREEVPAMISNVTTMPTQDAVRFRMPAGHRAGLATVLAMSSVGAEVYTKGTTVFADRAASSIRPNALVPGARSWSPPV
jgi:hypothetical protein